MAPRWLEELESEFHLEEWRRFFERHSLMLASLIVFLFISLGGYLYWSHAAHQRAEKISAHYGEAMAALRAQSIDRAEEMFCHIERSSHKGYAHLAHLSLLAIRRNRARLTYDADDIGYWLKQYKACLRTFSDPRYQVFHAFVSLAHAFDAVSFSRQLLPPLELYETPQNPWRSLVLEARALKGLSQDRPHTAVNPLKTLFQSDWVMPDVRIRAETLLMLLGERLS